MVPVEVSTLVGTGGQLLVPGTPVFPILWLHSLECAAFFAWTVVDAALSGVLPGQAELGKAEGAGTLLSHSRI